jgi:hypothetical protein
LVLLLGPEHGFYESLHQRYGFFMFWHTPGLGEGEQVGKGDWGWLRERGLGCILEVAS